MDDERLAQTKLHVAATRPAMFLGLPLELCALLFFTGAELAVFHLWWMVGGLVPVWLVCRSLIERDYNFIRVIFIWARTSGGALDSSLWGGASLTPFPLRPSKHFRGISKDAW